MSKGIKKVETQGLGCWPEVNYSTQQAPEMLGNQRYREAQKAGWGMELQKARRILKVCEQTLLAPPRSLSVVTPLPSSISIDGGWFFGEIEVGASRLGDTRHSGGWGWNRAASKGICTLKQWNPSLLPLAYFQNTKVRSTWDRKRFFSGETERPQTENSKRWHVGVLQQKNRLSAHKLCSEAHHLASSIYTQSFPSWELIARAHQPRILKVGIFHFM